MDRPRVASAFRLHHVRSRLLADWAWARLDREIAAGLPIEASEARLLRAQQLLCREQRRAVAAVLRNLLDAAEASKRAPIAAGEATCRWTSRRVTRSCG